MYCTAVLLSNAIHCRLYLDQPVGVGFSHGATIVGTSQEAAEDVWKVRTVVNYPHRLGLDPVLLVPANLLLRFSFQQISQERLCHLDRVVRGSLRANDR